jgi:hypothetical protein
MLCLCNAGHKNTLLLEPRALNSRTFEGLVGSNQWKDAAGNVIGKRLWRFGRIFVGLR